ncbi:MAG: hypothetical protein KAY32_08780 [Candidatus Eisenbacteria sp.]|nr:hypothetical protein [Candidatus Eisenbacteria bacterium]
MPGCRRPSTSGAQSDRRALGDTPAPGRRRAGGAHGRAGRLALLLCAALLLGGCLFSTRKDEGDVDPNGGAVWLPPVTLGNALGNMQRALEKGVLTNYGNSFNDSYFEMVLDPADLSELGQNEFDTWNASLEEQRMSGILISTEATLEVFWVPRDSVDQSSSVRYYEDLAYRLEFAEPTRSVTYSGKVDLWFEDDGAGEWYITKWIDKRDGSPNRTWSWLRARNQVEF